MDAFETSYTALLVAGNAATAGVMYAMSNPLYTAMLAMLGVVVLAAAVLTSYGEPQSGSAASETN